MLYGLLRALVRLETGRSCRDCCESILPRDAFGMSEGVCETCRR